MKKLSLIVILFALFCFFVGKSENDNNPKLRSPNIENVLNSWIAAHNSGSKAKIKAFILQYYHPRLQKKMVIEKHINFYWTVFKDFGVVETTPLKIVENTSNRLVVHFIKAGVSRIQIEIDPADILEVEIDMDENDNQYLSRGLGLGALVCKIKR